MDNEYIVETLKEHGEKINELEKGKVESTMLIKSMSDSHKELSESIKEFSSTMTDVRMTMVSIQNSLEDNRKDVQELKGDIVSVNGRMDSLNTAFVQDVEKNKIDIRDVTKDEGKKKLAKMFAYGGAITGVVAILGALYKIMEVLQQLSTTIHK